MITLLPLGEFKSHVAGLSETEKIAHTLMSQYLNLSDYYI